MERQLQVYNGKVWGYEISDYAVENGYLDYQTLAKMVGDLVLNNAILHYIGWSEWELVNGCEENEEGWYEVYQYYIISDHGYDVLSRYTDEIVYYHEDLDMYLWGITHFGTSWDYVLTDIKLEM